MEDQGKDGKIEADGEAATEDHSRNGYDQETGAKKNIKNEKRSKILSDSTYPSSTSYSTAEEGSSNGGGSLSNGDDVSSSIQNPKKNMSVEHLQAHIHHLEDLLAGKEAALIAIAQELDAVREMSCIDASIGPLAVTGFDNDFKASISEYNRKLQEHASALCQRDEMIQKLAETLKQSVRDREELKIEAERLTSQVHSLQTQLHSVGQHVQNPQTKLLEALKEKESELQKKSVELSQCKAQSAKEVQFLMSSLEELQQRAARATSSSPPVPKTNDEAERKLSRELKDLRKCYETDKKYFGDQLADAQRTESYLRAQVSAAQKECDKLNLDLSTLKLAHETQLSVCKDHQGIASSEHQKRLEVELRKIAELDNEIQLLRMQVSEKDKLSRKQGDRIQILQSQVQEYATDITTCHQTLEQYKKRIDELQTKHSEEMAQRESSLHSQNTQLNQHISELQEAHSRQLQNMHQDLNKMKQRQMEELATMQLSHENEVNTSKRDAERFRNELREKNNILAMQEEQLELERQWSRTYSQQVQELGEKLNKEEDKNEQYRGKIETLEQHLKELSEACKLYQPQIEFLHQQLKDERKKSVLVMHQLEDLHKQLSLEQDKCQTYVTSLDSANSNIEELQSKNSELQIQVQKQDESSNEKIKLKEQENASLRKELDTISEKLKQEQSQASAFKEVIETLNQQVKIYAAQEKHLIETQAQLEYEKQSSDKSKSQIESLNLQLDNLKSKNINDCQKFDVELQRNQTSMKKLQEETEDLKKELCNVQEANRQEKNGLEQQIKELTEGSRKSQEDSLEIEEKSQQAQALSDKYLKQVRALELKLGELSDANSLLKKGREESELELKRVQDIYADSKLEFENVSSGLREKLSMKEEEIVKLLSEQGDLVKCKEEINAYNGQVKELLCAKVSLENELTLAKEEYSKEIDTLKSYAAELEKRLETCNTILVDESVGILVRKCRDDIEFLRSHCSPNDCISNPEPSKEYGSDQQLNGEIFLTNRIPGLTALEKLLDTCEKCSSDGQTATNTSKVMAEQLSKLAYTVEKLEAELAVCSKENRVLQADRDELLAKIESLESKHLNLSSPDLHMSTSPPIPSKISDLIASWTKKCEDLALTNIELKSTVSMLQAKLTEVERDVSPKRDSTKSLGDILNQRCDCEKRFSEERNVLRNSIEILQKELTNKELHIEERIKNIFKKNKNSNQSDVDLDSFISLMNAISCKFKETTLLQNEFTKVKLENKLLLHKEKNQKELCEKSQISMEKLCQEYYSLQDDLLKVQKENNVLQARLIRVQNLYESIKKSTAAPNELLLRLIEELSPETTNAGSMNSSEDNAIKQSVTEKMKSVLTIIKKINTDCEATLVKLQNDNSNSVLCGYLQSEALGLRRLQSILTETQHSLVSKCGPAMQLHVDVLSQQLEEKDSLYQEVCQSLYSLETEMREMEEKFQQQDEHLQERLRKQESATRFWKLRAEGAQAQILTLQLIEQNQESDLSGILSEMDSMYLQALGTFQDELERVTQLRENNVRLELSEKILSAQKTHKQQMEELGKQIRADSTVRALQVLHQEEIEAVRAECDYARFKAIKKLQQDLPSSLKLPRVKSSMPCTELSLLLMKHSVSSRYNTAIRKVSTSVCNEVVRKLSLLEEQLGNASSNNDPNFEFVVPDSSNDDSFSFFEQLIKNVKEWGDKILKVQTAGLQSVLSVCEENHKLMTSKVQSLVNEFDGLCDVQMLQEQLVKLKEEHQLALGSLAASHKAEVSRLRLLLAQQGGTESSDTKETALSVLRKELEEKHKRQMEELRTYFEQKCADFEKHYSEEVFSQHSRKLSDCSSASESELVSEMYYAGPGSSSCSVQGAPSHFCDVLGESSFKDIEEQARSGDLEKLFMENREQLETMRLALESRHQGELEAQKEHYETKLEDLLRSLNECHTDELKLHNKCLKDMHDVEATLNKKLSEAEKEVSSLKELLNMCEKGEIDSAKQSKDVNQHQHSVTELETELKKLNDILKQKDLESASQIAALKRKLRLNDEVMSKLEKDISNLRSKYETDVLSLSSSVNEKVQEIKELSTKIQELSSCLEDDRRLRQQAECEMENRCLKLKEEYENKLKIKHEEYELRVADLVAQHVEELHKKDLETGKILEENLKKALEDKKAQLEAEYSEYLEFVKKCADDTKLQLLQRQDDEIKLLTDKYERQFSNMREAYESDSLKERQISEDAGDEATVHRPPSTLSNESFVKESVLCDCLQELIQLADKLSTNQQVQLENIIIKLCKEEERSQQKLHQDMEMRLHNVQSECERRFHLQLEEARGDIVKALEDQIQQLLDDDSGTVEKPLELQQLEKKFASKYLQKLSDLQKDHDARISDLHQRHSTQLSLARSKIQSAQTSPITHEELQKLYKERDCLRNVAATLRDVVAELVRYFMSWEDDFNNTLMDELVKLEGGRDNDILSVTHQENSFGIEQSPDIMQGDSSTSDDEMPVIVATPAKSRCLSTSLKRVHFAPDISGILSLIEDGSILEGVGLNCSLRDASLNFQEELERCLVRLRSESAALYALSKPALPTSLSSVSEVDDKSEGKLSNRLSEALQNVAKLQKENEDLRNQLKELHEEHEMSYAELLSNRMRVETLEHEVRQQAEIVAEGYGEGDQSIACDLPGSPRATTVEELQNKARSLILGVSNPEEISVVVSPNSSHHLPHVVEELCRDWERLAEESRHRQDDLQQQVEAADKQLRATRTFMDEQATEREQEREDFVQEIKRLQEILRDKDRDRTSQQQMNHEVEILEGQLKESQLALQDTRDKMEKLSAEHKQAVEKIWTLRDIISDLEVQVATKAEEAATAVAQNEALQTMVEQQGRTQLELAQEMEELQLCSGNGRLAEHITQLEDQLRKHQVLAEQLGDPSAIDQMKVQLNDLGASLELHTKELECAHASVGLPASPCLSSPSEDVSIRETLEAIRAAAERKEESKQPSSCVILPFNEVSQVSEQWQRHARADDAVLKKLRDLDMQLDDVQAEKDTLAAQLQEQMLLSSSLQAKLDEHRRKADVKLSIATTEMQSEIEDLKSEILNYAETLESREKQIESLRSSLRLIENDLRKREAEVQKSAEAERVIAAQLKIQVSKLSADKEKLQALLSEKDAMHGSLPALVESMLLDKNADIDRLEKQVSHLTKQMDVSSHYVATPSTTLGFEYVESEKVRAHVELSPVLELRRSLNIPTIIERSQPSHGFSNDTSLSLITRQMSFDNDAKMEPVAEVSLAPVPLEETVSQSQSVQNSNSGNVSDTLSSLTNTFDTSSLSSCEKKVAALEEELEIKNKIITDYLNQIDTNASIISELEQKCKHFEECERKITEISNREEELKSLRDKLQVDTNVMRDEFQRMIQAKDLEIQHLKDQLSTLHASTSHPQDKQLADELTAPEESSELEDKDSEIQRLRNEVSATQSTLANLQRKIQDAKQIARSPSRSSPDNNQTLRIVQNELDVARQEIAELKELCKSIRSEVEAEYQQKQNEFDDMLSHEQQAKQSLLETLENLKQEIKMKELNNLEEQLKEAEKKLINKEEEAQKLHSELNQLNMECVTLKNQLSTPVSEVTLLKRRLDAEKKFADALKEELLTFKNKASTLEDECKLLRERTKDLQSNLNTSVVAQEEHSKLLEEVSDLKLSVHSSLKEQNSYKKYIEKLSHENSVLKEENAEVGKELSDMKQVIIQMHTVKVSYEESEKNLQLKSNELNEVRMQMNTLSDNLSSLRRALKNIHSNSFDVPELAEDDRHILSKLQKQLITSNLRGAGDGPWNKLSLTATDIHEISPGTPELKESESLDNLTGLVQHELDLSVQLDHSLLQTIDSRSNNKLPSSSSTITQGKSMLKKAVPCEMKIAGSQANVECTQGNMSQHKILELEKELSQMKTALQSLHDQLETERAQYCKLQQQDCDLIEEMRLKLSEALDGQSTLHLQLQSELKKRKSSINDIDTKEGSTMLPKNELSASIIASKEKLQEQLNWATTELLQLRAEKDSMEKQLRRIQEVEIQRSRRRAVTEEKHRRHIDQLQSLHSETQQECLRLHEELAAANQKLLLAHEEFAKDRDAQLKNHAPFVERLKNMNTFLEEHIEENVRMAKQMEELTEEHRKLRRKIAQLEGQLAEKRSNESFEAMSAHFSAERAEWESEQKLLLLALNKAKQNEMRTPDSDVEERVSHLFGRYLRMQSYRKALVWQKRYLLSVITGMNESKALTASHLAACGNNGREKQLNPRRKFRSAVMVTMAIHRMQFMVERWLRGKRIGCGVVVQQTFSQYTIASTSLPQGQQTVYPSSHLSTGQLHSGLLSQSPPTLERPRQPRSQPLPSSQFSRSPLNNRELAFSNNLSETVTNFNLVQQRFDALLSNPPK